MIRIEAKNFKIHTKDIELIEKKVEKLLHLAGDMTDASTRIRVEFELEAKEKNLIMGSLTISLPHHDTLRAEARAEKSTLTVADMLVSKIKSQIERHKNK